MSELDMITVAFIVYMFILSLHILRISHDVHKIVEKFKDK